MTSGLETAGLFSKGKDEGEVNKKEKYMQEKRKQVTRKKTIYIAPKSTV